MSKGKIHSAMGDTGQRAKEMTILVDLVRKVEWRIRVVELV
jgi:hypothetical protein